jgi:hypothetical protein
MLVKGDCEKCSGHLEFEAEQVGFAVVCPHCGKETKLIGTVSKTPEPKSPAYPDTTTHGDKNSAKPSEILFYTKSKGSDKQQGPYSYDQIQSMWNNGLLTADMFCRASDSADWILLIEHFSDSGSERTASPAIETDVRCPFCCGEIPQKAVKCKHCGTKLSEKLESSGTRPIIAALASSCCVAGLGQILVGQIGKGLVLMLVCVVVAFVTGGTGVVIMWPLMGIDAYMVAKRQVEGKPVGPWEFFPNA